MTNMIRDEEQPQENKNTNPSSPPLNLQCHSFSSLPDEIAENILARVSRFNYPTLSLVSKRIHSLLSSPQLYKTRSLLKTTEPCLYICIRPLEVFTLWMKPVDETLTEDDYNDHLLPHDDYSLFSVHSSCSNNFLEPYYTSVAVGPELYIIGGTYKAPSSTVRILDCRTHTWRDGPSMLLPRWYVTTADAFLLDEKIYVTGLWGADKSEDWIEVFDVKTQTWRHVRSPGVDESDLHWLVINVFKGKMYAFAEYKSYAYDPQESTWEVVKTDGVFGFINDWCVVDDVMYCFTHYGHCRWYDFKAGQWLMVMGSDLEALRLHRTSGLAWSWMLRVRNLGGKLLVMWVPESDRNKREAERRIWCAKIALEKRGSEVWGKIEWANSVYDSCWFSSCVVSI